MVVDLDRDLGPLLVVVTRLRMRTEGTRVEWVGPPPEQVAGRHKRCRCTRLRAP